MIINVCLNDNQASRAFRKSAKFCETCGEPYLKVDIHTIQQDGVFKLVLQELKDEPPSVLSDGSYPAFPAKQQDYE